MDGFDLPAADVQGIWKQACASLQLQLSQAVFNTWIVSNPLTRLRAETPESMVGTITCPTAFHATNVEKNLKPQIASAISAVLGRPVDLEFVVGDPPSVLANKAPAAAPASQPVTPTQPLVTTQSQTTIPASLTPGPTQPLPASAPQPLSSLLPTMPSAPTPSASFSQQTFAPTPTPPHSPSTSFTQTQIRTGSPRVEDLFSSSNLQSASVDRAVFMARQVGLRLDYTFTTFAVSTTNEMAHAAASAVSNNPGSSYNPLFLYGGVGVGKTHLMHAIGNNILRNNPDTKILYVTGEEFTNEIVSAIQSKKGLRFKEKYRTAQVLLIDDVQFIAGKNTVQEEFFHTFNALTKQNSQIVLTSDRPPHEINLLEDRIKSRFEAGLMIDIQQPSFELRTAILLIKSTAVNVQIPMDLAQMIASRVDSARRIEGIITSIRSEVELKKRPISAELIEEILGAENNVQKKKRLKVSPSDVLRAVANHYHVKQAAIKGQKRVANLVQARHVAMYLLKEELNMPLTEIGKWFSNRDHTSALHGIRKISEEMESNEFLQRDVSALRMSLSAISK